MGRKTTRKDVKEEETRNTNKEINRIPQVDPLLQERRNVSSFIANDDDEKEEVNEEEEIEEREEEQEEPEEREERAEKPEEREEAEEKEEIDETELVTLKVYGKDAKATLKDVLEAGEGDRETGIRILQKRKAAEAREAEADRLLREANEKYKQLSKKDVVVDKRESKLSKEQAAEIARKLRYGEEEDAADTVLDLVSRVDKTLSREDLEETVRAVKLKDDIVTMLDTSPDEGGFKDIKTDPYLLAVANQKVYEKLQQLEVTGEKQTSKLYRDAFLETRKWKESFMPKDQSYTKDESLQRRDEKKKNIKTPPAGESKKRTSESKEKEETVQDIIEQMAKARPSYYG